MSQFGMHMPVFFFFVWATTDFYTGLMALAVVALIVACAMVYMQGAKVGADGSAIGLQDPTGIRLPK